MKFPSFSAALLCAALVVPSLAAAQTPYVRIEERLTPEQVRSVGLTPAQLEQLNRLLREAQERELSAAPAMAAAAPTAAPASAAATPIAATREPGGDRDRSSLIGFNDEPIRSRLKGPVSEWTPGTVFVLENGQQWKVLKGSLKLPRTLESPEVSVIPGVAGRWFLQVDEGMPKARVYRID